MKKIKIGYIVKSFSSNGSVITNHLTSSEFNIIRKIINESKDNKVIIMKTTYSNINDLLFQNFAL